MSDPALSKQIISAINKAQKGELYFEEIFKGNENVKKNEFIFFIKPEITLKSDKIKLQEILDLIFGKLEEFHFTIHNIKALGAKYLKDYNIIARHYGVINKIASNASENISESAKEVFKTKFNKGFNDVKVSGGIEFINEFGEFTPFTLDILWKNKQNIKLAGGTYCEDITMDNETIYLVNGFHPRQIEHFTSEGKSIIVFTISSDIDWSTARTNFIGATNPASAHEGSIRRELLNNKEKLGLDEVSQGANGVHLSAGPVEALIELMRYNSNSSDKSKIKNYNSFSFGQNLEVSFSKLSIEKILENTNVNIDGKAVSIFDITEEKNSNEALVLLRKHFDL
jgi:hypothetical protein